jgi:hypothetical protein
MRFARLNKFLREAEAEGTVTLPGKIGKIKPVTYVAYPEWMKQITTGMAPEAHKAWRARPVWLRRTPKISVPKPDLTKKTSREPEEEIPPTGREHSDTELFFVWDPENAAEVANNQKLFDFYTRQGAEIFYADKDGQKTEPMEKFDPESGSMRVSQERDVRQALWRSRSKSKSSKDLDTIVLPLEHGWTEAEIFRAYAPRLRRTASSYGKVGGKHRTMTFEDAMQLAAQGLLHAILTDTGSVNFGRHAESVIKRFILTALSQRKKIEKKEKPLPEVADDDADDVQKALDAWDKEGFAQAIKQEDVRSKISDLADVIGQNFTDEEVKVLDFILAGDTQTKAIDTLKKSDDPGFKGLDFKQSKRRMKTIMTGIRKKFKDAAEKIGFKPGSRPGTAGRYEKDVEKLRSEYEPEKKIADALEGNSDPVVEEVMQTYHKLIHGLC